MGTFVYHVKSSRGIHLEQLHQELSMLVRDYSTSHEKAKLLRVPDANYVLLVSNNHRLKSALSRDSDFILA